jgi:hypothetical protein
MHHTTLICISKSLLFACPCHSALDAESRKQLVIVSEARRSALFPYFLAPEYKKQGIVSAIACKKDYMSLDYAVQNSESLLLEAAREFLSKHLKEI